MKVSESKIAKLFINFFCMQRTREQETVLSRVCFPRKLWVWQKIHLKFVKLWDMKNLPWDRQKGSETVWHTVKPWELGGLDYQMRLSVYLLISPLLLFHSVLLFGFALKKPLFEFSVDKQHWKHSIYDISLFILMFLSLY